MKPKASAENPAGAPGADSSARIVTRASTRPEPVESGAALTELALAAREREPAAMRAFLSAIAPAVRGVCRGVLGSGHVDLDDAVQECLIEILRALPQYRAEGPALHYAKQIALRSAIAARKRGRSREQRMREFALEANLESEPAAAPAVTSAALAREVIDELPAVQAEALLMRAVLGFSIEEVAQATRVSINTAKSRLRVAKDTLRRQLGQPSSDEDSEGDHAL